MLLFKPLCMFPKMLETKLDQHNLGFQELRCRLVGACQVNSTIKVGILSLKFANQFLIC